MGNCTSDVNGVIGNVPIVPPLVIGDVITGTAPLEKGQEMFERLESPVTRDVKIL